MVAILFAVNFGNSLGSVDIYIRRMRNSREAPTGWETQPLRMLVHAYPELGYLKVPPTG